MFQAHGQADQALANAGGLALRGALLGAPLMVLLFVLFPRLAPLWGVPSDAMTGRSGLSATMQVGTIASLALDSSIAMRIAFEGRPPPQRDLYFRGPVLSNFDGREWRPSYSSRFPARYKLADNLSVQGAPIAFSPGFRATPRQDWTPDASPSRPFAVSGARQPAFAEAVQSVFGEITQPSARTAEPPSARTDQLAQAEEALDYPLGAALLRQCGLR